MQNLRRQSFRRYAEYQRRQSKSLLVGGITNRMQITVLLDQIEFSTLR